MPSRISQRASDIRRRHYLRNATTSDYWFDFIVSRLHWYHSRFGEDFCLIINGSYTNDDAYIIPWQAASKVFTDDALAADGRGRWIGTIKNSMLTLRPSGNYLYVAAYHNSFDLLGSLLHIGGQR